MKLNKQSITLFIIAGVLLLIVAGASFLYDFLAERADIETPPLDAHGHAIIPGFTHIHGDDCDHGHDKDDEHDDGYDG
jgi:hypothetical protein